MSENGNGENGDVEVVEAAPPPEPRLKALYRDEILAKLVEEFSYSSPFAAPRLDKIVLNMGVGEGSTDRKKIETAVNELTLISGQKAVVTRAKKSVAQFKIRDGMTIGCMVTLRRNRAYEFLDRLITIALPRVRDFRGVSANSFDGRGNFAMGLKEQIVFPEIDYDQIDSVRGMDIVICTTAQSNDEGRALLRGFNMPFAA